MLIYADLVKFEAYSENTIVDNLLFVEHSNSSDFRSIVYLLESSLKIVKYMLFSYLYIIQVC
jgi:hypothetical protein